MIKPIQQGQVPTETSYVMVHLSPLALEKRF